MKLVIAVLLPSAVQGFVLSATSSKDSNAKATPSKKSEESAGPTYKKDAYSKDWQTEWKNGDFPSWKETYPKAALRYEDRQSDGKASKVSLLQAEPDKKKGKSDGPTYNKDAYSKDWHTEWKNGDFPSWKETYPKAALPYEDRQSDGKISKVSLLQATPSKKKEESAGPTYKKEAYSKDWQTEWKNGDFPSWKETYPKAALRYEDRQSDGKASKVSLLQAEPDKKKAKTDGPTYNKDAYSKDWHTEWKNGDFPSWKETYPKAALPYEDRQSDGKIGNFLQVEPENKDDVKGPTYNKDAYKKEWHKEWKNGDFPSWKETYPKEALPYEDRQSDGKVGS